MHISAPEITRTADRVRYSVRVRDSRPDFPESLWFEMPARFADWVCDKSDAALLALILPAMTTGEPVHVEGRVSRKLLAQLDQYLPLLKPVLTKLKPSTITVSATTDETYPEAKAVATGYSGGIDSFTTILRPRAADEPPISVLVHNNTGSHGRGALGRTIFTQRLARAQVGADKLGLPLIGIDTNVEDFYGAAIPFMSSHPTRNTATLLVLQRGIAVYEYSSSTAQGLHGIIIPIDITRLDLDVLPLLRTESFRVKPTGAEYTRLEKVLLVTSKPVTDTLLDVCMKPRRARGRPNCSGCIKCLRAQFLLDVTGRLARYTSVFNVRKYAVLRSWQIAWMLRGQLEQPDLILGYALEHGLKVPRTSRFYALPWVFPVANAWFRLLARFL